MRAACLGVLLCGGCEAAEGVKVQPLPPLHPPSPEARAGLPVVAGVWRFAGWEVPPRDTAAARAGLTPLGEVQVRTQRLDSVAGSYVRDGAGFPFVGEVRRDGIFSFVAFDAQGAGSFAAGRVLRDTLWIELTSLSAAQGWPPGTRAALVRRRAGPPFLRFPGVALPRPDSAARDSLARADSARLDSLRAAAPPPAGGTQPAPPPVRRDTAAAPRPRPRPTPPVPRPLPDTQRRDTQPRPPVEEPPPEPLPDTVPPAEGGTGVALAAR